MSGSLDRLAGFPALCFSQYSLLGGYFNQFCTVSQRARVIPSVLGSAVEAPGGHNTSAGLSDRRKCDMAGRVLHPITSVPPIGDLWSRPARRFFPHPEDGCGEGSLILIHCNAWERESFSCWEKQFSAVEKVFVWRREGSRLACWIVRGHPPMTLSLYPIRFAIPFTRCPFP